MLVRVCTRVCVWASLSLSLSMWTCTFVYEQVVYVCALRVLCQYVREYPLPLCMNRCVSLSLSIYLSVSLYVCLFVCCNYMNPIKYFRSEPSNRRFKVLLQCHASQFEDPKCEMIQKSRPVRAVQTWWRFGPRFMSFHVSVHFIYLIYNVYPVVFLLDSVS